MDKNIQKALLPSHGREKEAFNPLQIQVTADSKTPDLCVQALFASAHYGRRTSHFVFCSSNFASTSQLWVEITKYHIRCQAEASANLAQGVHTCQS